MRPSRHGGRLPEPVTRALDLLRSLGHGAEAQAALDALMPRPPGRPRSLARSDFEEAAAAFGRQFHADPTQTFTEASRAVAMTMGGTMTPRGWRRRLERHCDAQGVALDEWIENRRARS